MIAPWCVPARPQGLVECGAVVWTHRQAAVLSVVAKSAHALTPPFAAVAAAPLAARDVFDEGEPRRVRAAADLLLRLPRAEVLHAGRVIAPAGVTMARIAIFRGATALLDKRRLAKVADGATGLGPIAGDAPERAAASLPAPTDDGVLHLPDGFDFSAAQAAPADQRCDELLPGDRLLLGNLHPTIAELVVPLPLAPPTGRALAGGNVASLAFACRRVSVDTDAGRITLVWLATLTLQSAHAAKHLSVDVSAPGAVTAPAVDARGLLARAMSGAQKPPPATAASTGTMILDDVATSTAPGTGTVILGDQAPAAAPTPFAASAKASQPRRGAPDASATPWAGGDDPRPRATPKADSGVVGTMVIDEGEMPAAAPLGPPPAPPPPPSAPEAVAAPVATPVAPPRPKTREEVWGRAEEAAAPAPAPLPKPKPPPRANALDLLYRKGK